MKANATKSSQSARSTRSILGKLGATAAVAVTGLALAGQAFASNWDIDPTHVTAQFSVRHMMVSTVRGQFDKVSGHAVLDDKDMTKSSVELSLDVNSINTREPKRDAHLKSPDFFDAAKFPTLTFKSTKVAKAGGKSKFKVTGDLTMHGVTKPVTLDVTITDAANTPWGGTVRGVSASGKLDRKQWGLGWNKALDAGGVLVGEEVELQIDAELSAVKPPQAT